MSENKPRYPLTQILVEDLFSANKLVFFLLMAIVISAMGTVWMTYQTRLLINENAKLVMEKQAFETEYINLELQETTSSDRARVQNIAKKYLKMQELSPENEVEIRE